MNYAFADCTLDARLFELRRNGYACHVEPQVFSVLLYLLQHRDRVVPKEELLEEVWGDQFVTEATLNSRIMAARKAIGDDGSKQQFIKTVRGRGFRFIGEVKELTHELTSEENQKEAPDLQSSANIAPAYSLPDSPRTFGRESELRHLRQRLNQSLNGQRQLVFVTGEAGIGKTTLLQKFLSEATTQNEYWLLQGQCLDQHGAGEAYMPLLSALGRLCRQPEGEKVTALLMQCAPTWLVQMPLLISPTEFEKLQPRTADATRERMLREMVETLEVLSEQRPLVLTLEDLHWSDYSTLDLLSWLARRPGAARLMIIGTFRPADARANGHPLRQLAQELRIRGLCAELALSYLDEDSIRAYLQSRFPDLECEEELVAIIHQRTEGNPLFVCHVLDDWVDRHWLEQHKGQWTLKVPCDSLANHIPDNLRHLIEQQIEQLSIEERQLLEAASVAGAEFTASALANAQDNLDLETVEIRCAELARQGRFLLTLDAAEWPDGTLAERFGFTHHLYPEVIYTSLPAGRCARLHRQIGEQLETGHGSRTREIAPELAAHFLRGRDAAKAVAYSQQAAEQALSRSACHEAIAHLRRALNAIENQPQSEKRLQQEVGLQCALGIALVSISGWQAPEVAQAYHSAYELSRQLDDPVLQSSALYGLSVVYEAGGDYEKAAGILEQQLKILDSAADTVPNIEKSLLESHELLACSFFHQGRFELACNHADEGLKYYQPGWYSEPIAAAGENAGAGCHGWAALSLWYDGYPDSALRRMQTALETAHLPHQDVSVAYMLSQIGVLHQLRGEIEKVAHYADATLELAHKGGFSYRSALGNILSGWVMAACGQHEAGIERLQQGLAVCRSIGAIYDLPYLLALLAEAFGQASRYDEGQAILEEAHSVLPQIRPFFFQPELHRLQGELLLKENAQGNRNAAIQHFHKALELSRALPAKSLELRAATSLYQLTRSAEDHQRLSEIYKSFTEGFETADLQGAKAILRL